MKRSTKKSGITTTLNSFGFVRFKHRRRSFTHQASTFFSPLSSKGDFSAIKSPTKDPKFIFDLAQLSPRKDWTISTHSIFADNACSTKPNAAKHKRLRT